VGLVIERATGTTPLEMKKRRGRERSLSGAGRSKIGALPQMSDPGKNKEKGEGRSQGEDRNGALPIKRFPGSRKGRFSYNSIGRGKEGATRIGGTTCSRQKV